MARIYNDPINGDKSSIGAQLRTDSYHKKSLISIRKEQYFSPLADVRAMPKHAGKAINQYHYLPLLDDKNINDQGIDAVGALLDASKWYVFEAGKAVADATGYADEATALAAVTNSATQSVTSGAGNLFASSKDIGAVTSKLPALTETGGNVNRVGFTRVTIKGTISKFGFYSDYTQESMDFDTDSELQAHIVEESLVGANEITEAALQADLLEGAGTLRFPGAASTRGTISGETGAVTQVTYEGLMRLAIDLDNARCPKSTKVITGSRMVDTKVINSARFLFVGSELLPTLYKMQDLHGDAAFVEVRHYASAGNTINGEVGSIGQFRIVVVPEMMKWAGKGATVVNNDGYQATGGKYDVFPMLVVGSGSFTTIGFQTDGKTVKFKIKNSLPGSPESFANDKYGETGFHSIKWYYGTMVLRSEWLGLMHTVAEV